MTGAFILKGPQNWQIIQQKDGFADITLSGKWKNFQASPESTVFIRVVSENTGVSVIRWQPCVTHTDGAWEHCLNNVPAGGLYRIETCVRGLLQNIELSTRGDMIHHIGVGDIFVIAGQSNASGIGRDAIVDAPELGVHLYRNNGKWDLASHPLNDSTDSVHDANYEFYITGTSPYLSFAKFLKKELNYPIGLIETALGASPLSAWNPDEDGVLYHNMTDCIDNCGGRVKGVLWYQGCSDCFFEQSRSYLKRFTNMVSKFRELTRECTPFLTVQINRVYDEDDNSEIHECWSIVRDAQRIAAETMENIFIIPTLDLTLSDGIHNGSSSNLIIGERLAKAALYEIYETGNAYRAPFPIKIEKKDNRKVLLTFENVYQRLYSIDRFTDGIPFTVIDKLGEVKIETAEYISFNTVAFTLSRDLSENPRMHCGFGKNPKGHLPVDFETFLPVLSFYNLSIL